MTMLNSVDSTTTLQALVRCRHTVLQRATALLDSPTKIPLVEQYDAVPRLSALLTTSLEELKVAEEELREQNEKLAAQKSVVDEQARFYRQLFLHAPLPAFITDTYGNIQQANLAAATLFRREANHLERKPLAALLPRDRRDAFRKQLKLITADGVRDWPLVLQRVGDTPVNIHAAVQVVPDIGASRTSILYWMLRVTTE
jgi:PAS domain S-box-containing protein